MGVFLLFMAEFFNFEEFSCYFFGKETNLVKFSI